MEDSGIVAAGGGETVFLICRCRRRPNRTATPVIPSPDRESVSQIVCRIGEMYYLCISDSTDSLISGLTIATSALRII